jgi:hypothetical protein
VFFSKTWNNKQHQHSLTTSRLQPKILSRKHPHLAKNEEGSGSEQVRYRPPEKLLSVEKFLSLLRFEQRSKLIELL